MNTKRFSTSLMFDMREEWWPVNYYCCRQDFTQTKAEKLDGTKINNINGSGHLLMFSARNKSVRGTFCHMCICHKLSLAGRRLGTICEMRDILRVYVCAHMPPRNPIQLPPTLAHFAATFTFWARFLLFFSFSSRFEIMLHFVVGLWWIRLLLSS